jgi:NSS family neurotransmitter:Na+ symporter
LVYVLFCTWDRKGWGWDRFLTEANMGKGLAVKNGFKIYMKYVLPIILIIFWAYGIVAFFI